MTTSLPLLLTWEEQQGERQWSPSGIGSFLECQRKWAWRKIAKIEAPGGAGAELGTRTHAVLERYLGEGTMPDFVADSEASTVASSGLHMLPAPKTEGMLLEQHFRFKSVRTGLIYHGFKDVEIRPGVPVPSLGLDGTVPIVIDHKTTKSIASYAKTESDLQDDAQSVLYGLDSMARFNASAADLAWIYYQTKGAKRSHATVTRLHLKQAMRVFNVIEEVAAEASEVLDKGLQPLDLPPNPSACSAFGGCPYRELCNLSPSQKARSRMSSPSSAIADLRARLNKTPAAPSVMGCSAEDVPAPTEIPAFLLGPVQINPPENALPAPAPQTASEEVKEKRKRRTKAEMAASKAPPTLEELAAEGIDIPQAALPPIESPQALRDLSELVGKVQAEVRGFTLYVDCVPIGRPAKAAAGLISKAQDRILKEHGVPDYRLIDFGKGVPFFVAFVDEQVDGTFDLALDTRTPEGAVLLETLAAKAACVVRGFR